MDDSGPTPRSQLEEDLALSDDDEWPLPSPLHRGYCGPSPVTTKGGATSGHIGLNPDTVTSSVKRVLNSSSDSNDASSSHAAKTAKQGEASGVHNGASVMPAAPPSVPCIPAVTSMPAQASPAFAPRDEYVKLLFRGTPSVETKLRWLSEVNKYYSLDRTLAEVKMSAVTSRFVYISRKRVDIIDSVMKGDFLSLFLDAQDSSQRSRKYPTYLLTRYPVCVDPSLAKTLPGVHGAKRFIQDGEPINRIVITWSLLDPPPPYITFEFLPSLPPCEVRRMKDEQPWCYRCWGIGHISRYCSRSEKCAWCAGQHHSYTCPHRPQSSSAGSASASRESASPAQGSDLPTVDTSRWRCPRCRETGVNVWHGCTRRPAATSAVAPSSSHRSATQSTAAPQAAFLPANDVGSVSSEVASLKAAVASMTSQCSSYTARFEAIERRMDSFASQQAEMHTKISAMMEAQKAFSVTITDLVGRINFLATHIERVSAPPLASSSSSDPQQRRVPGTPSSSFGRSTLKSKHR